MQLDSPQESDEIFSLNQFRLEFSNTSEYKSTLNSTELKITRDSDFWSSLKDYELVINSDTDRIEITAADGIKFKNGITINSPTAGNSGLSQSGNIAHADYPKEIQLVIGGVTYAIPARLV